MKKTLLIAIAALTVMGCEQKDQVIVQGNIEGFKGMIWLSSREKGNIDSVQVTDGKFSFTVPMNIGPALLHVADGPQFYVADFSEEFIMEPGTVTISRTAYKKSKVSGTPLNDRFFKFNAQMEDIVEEYYDSQTEQEADSLMEIHKSLMENEYQANKDNVLGLVVLYDLMNLYSSGQELLAELEAMPKQIQAFDNWEKIKKYADKLILTSVGSPYLDFTQSDAAGNPVSLKSVVEKPGNRYILLDFWASWCGPCMDELPSLTKCYADFHDKGFEVIGVSADKEKEEWLNAISENGLEWINVSDLKFYENEVSRLYGVNAYPSNFLIDCKTGLFVARNLRGNELRKKLEELL